VLEEAEKGFGSEKALLFLWNPVLWRAALEGLNSATWRTLCSQLASVAGAIVEGGEIPPYFRELASALATAGRGEQISFAQVQRQASLNRRGLSGALALLCSMDENVSPAQAAYFHMLAFGMGVWDWAAKPLIEQLLLPFLVGYWGGRLRVERYRFKGPRLVEAALASPKGDSPLAQAAFVLQELGSSLSVPLLAEVGKMLSSTAPAD
jgi:hypothetical protein